MEQEISDIDYFPSPLILGAKGMSEAFICTVSPLGFHLRACVKERIWKNEYIDLLSLLPSVKDFPKADKKDDNGGEVICNFASVMGNKFPEK